MTRAYETKILSFMVSKPATQEIRSFQDMAQSGVKLKYNPKVNPFVFEERALRDLLVESNDTLPNLDLIHAYIAERSISELKLIPMYYDPVNKMYRYSVMEQSFGMFPVVYKFSARSPLKAVFGFTLTTFIESGIFNFWETSHAHRSRQNSMFWKLMDTNSVLYFRDIFPAFLVISYGHIAGGIVFTIEVFISKLIMNCKKFRFGEKS